VRDEDFERLYAEHARPLLGFLVQRTGNRVVAEDLLAETFERVLRARWRFNPGRGSEKTWIYTIALNCLRDQLRKHTAETRALERTGAGVRSEGSEDWSATVEDRDELDRALASLSPEERDAIALRYGGDLTIPEIAKLLRERESTIRGRVFRGLGKLRETME
jgi:RNA polymerase sigma-70 factor (ECF subfamily)